MSAGVICNHCGMNSEEPCPKGWISFRAAADNPLIVGGGGDTLIIIAEEQADFYSIACLVEWLKSFQTPST
jgi:hypothetical protein